MIGLFVDLSGFRSFQTEHGAAAATALRTRFVARAIEIVGEHQMTLVRTSSDGIVFIGNSQETALRAAFACAAKFAPDHPYFPIHVSVHRGNNSEVDDAGRALHLTAWIKAAPHPEEPRPADRGKGPAGRRW